MAKLGNPVHVVYSRPLKLKPKHQDFIYNMENYFSEEVLDRFRCLVRGRVICITELNNKYTLSFVEEILYTYNIIDYQHPAIFDIINKSGLFNVDFCDNNGSMEYHCIFQ